MKPDFLKTLQLEKHLKCAKLVECKKSTLGLLHVYITNNPTYRIEKLVSDKESVRLFKNWRLLHKMNSHRAEKLDVRPRNQFWGSADAGFHVQDIDDFIDLEAQRSRLSVKNMFSGGQGKAGEEKSEEEKIEARRNSMRERLSFHLYPEDGAVLGLKEKAEKEENGSKEPGTL